MPVLAEEEVEDTAISKSAEILVPVEEEEAEVESTNATKERIEKLAGAASISASLSVLIAAIFRNSIGWMASHILFIVAVAVVGLVLDWGGDAVERLDVGLVVMLFIFEPLGRILLHLEAMPPHALLALPLVMVAAFFFRRGGSSEAHGEIEQ